TGATYDEHIGRDGSRLFDVKELRLSDTFDKQPDTTFQKGRDNPGEIEGTLAVSVVPISQPVVVMRKTHPYPNHLEVDLISRLGAANFTDRPPRNVFPILLF